MLGDALLTAGAITSAQLEQAITHQRTSGALLGEVLLSLNFITKETLTRTLAHQAGVPFMVVDGLQPEAAAVALVPEKFARTHLVAPLSFRGLALQVLQANPFDVLALQDLRRLVGRPIVASCATDDDVRGLLERCYTNRGGIDSLVPGVKELETSESHVATDDPSVVRLLDMLMQEALGKGATDWHIEPEEHAVPVRFRVDGVLIPGEMIPKGLHAPIVARLKTLCGLDISETTQPQDGRMSQTVNGRRVDLRVVTSRTPFGEKATIRILEKEKLIRGLTDLGLSRKNLTAFHDILRRSRGLVLVAGPSDAGKTTTLYSALSHLGSAEGNILTVEDPVEYQIPMIRQTQVRAKAGLTFATAIRSLLRQEPDVMMVGEIPDPETAQLALRAALSGILVFSTIQTQDSADAVPRLTDLGLEPYLLASGLIGVIAQRLIRVICADCKTPVSYPAETLTKVGLAPDASRVLHRGRGCHKCGGTGYRGRTGVFEILMVDAAIQGLIRDRADSRTVRQAAVTSGMKTLVEEALAKAIFGQTTIEEVLRVAEDSASRPGV